MDKTYRPAEMEQRWYQRWESMGLFSPRGDGVPYCIALPPPNVTGSLHMGHGFQQTLIDALVRYRRMRGDQTLWQGGVDHAGIATQIIVENQLAAEGITREQLGRGSFVTKVWDWKQRSGDMITRQQRRLGVSLDWQRERFTMDEDMSAAVREAFVRLHADGLIYRGHRMVNWDPALRSAVSDLEVATKEEDGHLWHFRYPLEDGSGHLTVATTRPETMLGDTAVAVHPEDERYRQLIGQHVIVPLVERRVPIIADDYVDPAFGSGCVKITPAHDFNDHAIGERHGLPTIDVMTEQGEMSDAVPEAYRGLDRFDARERVAQAMDELGLLERVQSHRLRVPRGDRSGVVLEPRLTAQWFVRAEPLAKPAIDAVADGRIRFVPEQWQNTYFVWLREIQDWCISRQLWWGHRIPAWYAPDGTVHVGRDEQEARASSGLAKDVPLRQDEDVLDTWFSSALWTFATLGWPKDSVDLKRFHPTDVLVTGFDIIFFWVARMVMMSLYLLDEVPFRTVLVHGLVRDARGDKMSKSKGNVLDPLDLIDGIELDALVDKRAGNLLNPSQAKRIAKQTRGEFPEGIASYGTDALRFTFCALASSGRDIHFDLGRVAGYRNFCNKLWNAARYVLMTVKDKPVQAIEGHCDSLPARWIRSRTQHVIQTVTEALDAFRFDLAAKAIHEFVWHEYCDWFLEASKLEIAQAQANETDATEDASASGDSPLQGAELRAAQLRWTLLDTLDTALRLLHPFMPFITEEIWQRLGERNEEETLLYAAWPVADAALRSAEDEALMHDLRAVVASVRHLRTEFRIAPTRELTAWISGDGNDAGDAQVRNLLEQRHLLCRLARLALLKEHQAEQDAPACTSAIGSMELCVPLAGIIDHDEEAKRLGREISRLDAEIQRGQRMLSNAKFIERAPAAVTEAERQKAASRQIARTRLQGHLDMVSALRQGK